MTTLSKEDIDLAAEKFNYSDFSSEFRTSADGLHAFADHIATLARADLVAENERLRDEDDARYVHSCGPKCMRAGCVNRRLRAELAAAEARETKLRDTATSVLFNELDKVDVHPCDKDNRDVQAKLAAPLLKSLYDVLAQPRDNSTLREMIAGVYEECANVCEISDRYRGDYFAEKIRELAEKAKV